MVEPGIALVVSVEIWWRNRSIVRIYCAHNLVIWTGHRELSEIMETVVDMVEMKIVSEMNIESMQIEMIDCMICFRKTLKPDLI